MWPASGCQPKWAHYTHALLSSFLHSWNMTVLLKVNMQHSHFLSRAECTRIKRNDWAVHTLQIFRKRVSSLDAVCHMQDHPCWKDALTSCIFWASSTGSKNFWDEVELMYTDHNVSSVAQIFLSKIWDTFSAMVIVIGNRICSPSSNLERSCLSFNSRL